MKEPVIEGQWKEAIDQEYTSERVQVTGPKRANSQWILVPSCWPFLFSCSRKRNRKDHFQSINLKAVKNISQLYLLVPVLEIPASRVVSARIAGNVSQNNHIPHSLQNYSWQENIVA